MVNNILKVDPVAFRYEEPDDMEGSGLFRDKDDFEWSADDFNDGFEVSDFDEEPDPGFDSDFDNDDEAWRDSLDDD